MSTRTSNEIGLQSVPSILVVDDHAATLTALRILFTRKGWRVRTAASGREGLACLSERAPSLALIDLNMDDLDGLSLLAHMRERGHLPPCLMISAENSVPNAVEAMRLGARDFLVKPLEPELVIERVAELLGERTPLPGESARQAWRERHAARLIGEHPRLLHVLHMLERIAPTEFTVLIQGESGTGKELVARALHSASSRREGPFVPVNCAAIPDQLIESELFGHTRGAFSGATSERDGCFATADGGTLFLDEIGEFTAATQAKLLRVLQDGEFTRIGESRPRRADVRILAATNRSLEVMVEQGTFRRDLFYRLNQLPIELPALRERATDIPLLARHFLRRASQHLGRGPLRLSAGALTRLQHEPWPGNVRELEHTIERMLVLHVGGEHGELEFDERSPPAPPRAQPETVDAIELPESGIDLPQLLAQLERSLIEQALVRTEGNKSGAARLLGLNRTTLVEKLRRSRDT